MEVINDEKYGSPLDFAWDKVDELEKEACRRFPATEDTEPELELHVDLLGALPIRMLGRGGWDKYELLAMFSDLIDSAVEILEERPIIYRSEDPNTVLKKN